MKYPIRIAINGFGRIGRKILRLALNQPDFQVVAINDPASPEQIAHLLKYDSVHGKLADSVHLEGSLLLVGPHRIPLFSDRNPSAMPWSALEVDWVHECTGSLVERAKAELHLKAGAKKVLISAPSPDADATICLGVNEQIYDPRLHQVISNASCTTNCLAPIVKVLDDAFGIVRGTLLTVHSYTNDQRLLDVTHKDLRRSRAAGLSQIPTSTGAAKAVGLVIPHLKGKLDGLSIRVPTPNVSLVDFTGQLQQKTTLPAVLASLEQAALGDLKGILGYSLEPLVSTDYNGSTLSATIDAQSTYLIEGEMVKVIAWYDNESGFSCRMLDVTRVLAAKS